MTGKIQRGIRVYKEQWDKASEVCDRMNTNLSAVINQLLAQIIIQERIPFSLFANKQENVQLPEEGMQEDMIRNPTVPYVGTSKMELDALDDDSFSDDDEDDQLMEEDTGDKFDWGGLDIFGTSGKAE